MSVPPHFSARPRKGHLCRALGVPYKPPRSHLCTSETGIHRDAKLKQIERLSRHCESTSDLYVGMMKLFQKLKFDSIPSLNKVKPVTKQYQNNLESGPSGKRACFLQKWHQAEGPHRPSKTSMKCVHQLVVRVRVLCLQSLGKERSTFFLPLCQ